MSSCGVTGAMLFYWTATLRHLSIAPVCRYMHILLLSLSIYIAVCMYTYCISSQIMNMTFSLLALQEPQNKISLHTYIAVSLCAVAVAVITIMSTFIANYLYKRHRIKQQMNTAFQVLAVNTSIYTYPHSSIN